MGSYLIGIDIGTSATKTVLYDTAGNICREASAEYPMYQPQNGQAEQNPQDWWQAADKTLTQVTAGIDTEKIAGIGLSGQMHGLVMLDEKGEVLRPAIIWCDGRTGRQCEQITELVGRDTLLEITANPALAGFTASKIMWVKEHEPEIFAKCRHILLPKDYIRYRLTGVFATDVSDASGMQLMDIKNRCWSELVLQKLQIPPELLPRLYESCEITGHVSGGALRGVPVVAGAGDNAAAAVGTGTVRDGRSFVTIGTSGVLYAHTDSVTIDPKGRVHTFCCAVPGKWHVMGVTQSAGLSLKWFHDNFCPNISYSEIDAAAEKLPIGCERLIFLPYLMGERTPHLNPNARGVFFGLSALHTSAHMARAVMEGVSFSLRDCLEVLRQMNLPVDNATICGGGGKSAFWRQMIADVFGFAVQTLKSDEAPALGSAILAGVGSGVFESVEAACDILIKPDRRHEANSTAEYEKYYSLYQMLYLSLEDGYNKLNNII